MELREGEVVMCTVNKIEGTTIFLDIEDRGKGTMVMSEVAAGRIRNLREYVVPNKKIVCKVLNISNGYVELTLRRVTGKERDEVQDRFKKSLTFQTLIKKSAKEPGKVIEKIKAKYSLWEFFDIVKKDKKQLAEFFNKEESDKLSDLVAEKEETEKVAKQEIVIKSQADLGIQEIKELLDVKGTDIRYLGSSRFSVAVKAKDFKEANAELTKILVEMGNKAKIKKVFFEVREK